MALAENHPLRARHLNDNHEDNEMIRIFQNVTAADPHRQVEQAWRLRHHVFVEEKNGPIWRVPAVAK